MKNPDKTRQNKFNLLDSLNKEELLLLIKQKAIWSLTEHDILSVKWDIMVKKASTMAAQSISLSQAEGHKAFLESQKLWDRADRLGKKADVIFKQMEKLWSQRNKPNAQPG